MSDMEEDKPKVIHLIHLTHLFHLVHLVHILPLLHLIHLVFYHGSLYSPDNLFQLNGLHHHII